MPRRDTLLAHLAFKFTGNHELLATEGLAFVLQNSGHARAALYSLVTRFCPGLPEDMRYSSERVGEDRERPDIVGLDPENTPRVIIEGKFWAGLTAHQPLTYLESLPPTSPGALVFAVPEARLEVLWREVSSRVKQAGFGLAEESTEPSLRVGILAEKPHCLLFIGWPGLFGLLETACIEEDRAIGESIRQLAGLCEAQDREAFLPLRSEEITSAELAKRTLNFVQLTDDLVEHLRSVGFCSVEGYQAAPQRDGYVRYLLLGGYLKAAIKFCCTRWLRHGISPIWLLLQNESAAAGRKALKSVVLTAPRKLVEEKGRLPAVPIVLSTDTEYERLVDQCAREIQDLVEKMRLAWDEAP